MKAFLIIILGAMPFLMRSQNQLVLNTKSLGVSCAGRSDGIIIAQAFGGSFPVRIQWRNVLTGTSGENQISEAGGIAEIKPLPKGSYRVNFTAANNERSVLETDITEPVPLLGRVQVLTNFNGYNLLCPNDKNGRAVVTATGGWGSYTYLWSNGETSGLNDKLTAGTHEVTVTDDRGCSLNLSTNITAPPPITTKLEAQSEKCVGDGDGLILLRDISGGIGPYMISFNKGPFESQTLWDSLRPATYFVTIQDANGCERAEGIVLPAGQRFTFDAGRDTAVFIGDTLRLRKFSGRKLSKLLIEPISAGRSTRPEELLLFPANNTNFIITAIDTNGCQATDNLFVQVRRQRNLFAPNVFAPNATATENQYFTLYVSGGVREIAMLQVRDRFGRIWFENQNFQPGQPTAGWNGRSSNGTLAPEGVYLWIAKVRYTDGRNFDSVGEVTLVR
jgi:SprB repeat/CHU_C Type IX secretion signal domain